ncbi:MAG: UDP-N-acetylmuramoyl-L-alanine--D-glutamate ligase, partial [Magnetococcales bacterium]|nr:UDP-N-acetylmuramoyl-L-alanine--D-glutamate ligase [Magnetococcales bacterium]
MTSSVSSSRSIGVLGLGRSGRASVQFLLDSGCHVVAWDQGRVALEGVELWDGPLPVQRFHQCEAILLSPGIPRTHPGVAELIGNNIPVINDCEWLFRQLQAQTPPPEFVAITGTNGKSTVTTLVGEMLTVAGIATATGGNLGQAALSLWHRDIRSYVLELSSFQLESMDRFRANSAALLNISPDHMDRYPNLQAYLDAKLAIFRNQMPGDSAVINTDDPGLWPAAPGVFRDGVEVIGFSIEHPVPGGVYVQDGWLIDHRRGDRVPILETARIRIQGRHNLANAAAAAALALGRGARHQIVAHVLESFPGLPHRMQWVRMVNGVDFYNDSKGTNVG